MFHCILCAFDVELDDTVVTSAGFRCICLRCYSRETGSFKSMTKALRKELVSTLGQVE